jgi:hypothetical protein
MYTSARSWPVSAGFTSGVMSRPLLVLPQAELAMGSSETAI